MNRKIYLTDVSDEAWAFCHPISVTDEEDEPQQAYPLWEVFNELRDLAYAVTPWRIMPNDLSPWQVVYQQTQR